MMTHGTEGPRDHDPRDVLSVRRFEYVAGAQYVGFEQPSAVTRAAVDRGDHGSAVVHALATPHGFTHGFRVAEIAPRAFHVKFFDSSVVVIRMEQHAYAFAVGKQPHDQVDTQMTRGAGHECETGAGG